ncbi:MerR family transcriptional regulator [Periweissella cryptocerci]|uniref:MerR family transcriptional regulator n=1 Tax=Periweissella cryptocerci TaxID=2506420 RepID=A0A4P6YR24_9LACO|nr:MerR family transcriptional regulator [Periweissella cryptocerci]QBO35061.1 MerR family transcriptional regulator [Periweissella cryptocerci]
MTKSISSISAEFGISAYTLRFYEKEGLVSVPRNSKGIREYDEQAIRRINAIAHYRRTGLSLAEIKQIFTTPDDQQFHIDLLTKQLAKIEQQLADLQQTHEFLLYKIDRHTQLLDEQLTKAVSETKYNTGAQN